MTKEERREFYAEATRDQLYDLCLTQDESIEYQIHRAERAEAVLQSLAEQVGIYGKDLELYQLDEDGTSMIGREITNLISRAGNKATMKMELEQLRQENEYLKSLIKVVS